jgi:hypothetical protein
MLEYHEDEDQEYATLTVSVQGAEFVALIPTESSGLKADTLRYEVANRLQGLASRLRSFTTLEDTQ